MTYVVTDNCIKCKYTDCVEVCPVDCIHPRKDEPAFQAADKEQIRNIGVVERTGQRVAGHSFGPSHFHQHSGRHLVVGVAGLDRPGARSWFFTSAFVPRERHHARAAALLARLPRTALDQVFFPNVLFTATRERVL